MLCQHWFYQEGDTPRPNAELVEKFEICRERGVNLLLDVAPVKHGVIPRDQQKALTRLRRMASL